MQQQEYRKHRQKEATKQGSINSTSRIDSVARYEWLAQVCVYAYVQQPFLCQDSLSALLHSVQLRLLVQLLSGPEALRLERPHSERYKNNMRYKR